MNRDRLHATLKRDEGFDLNRHEVAGIDHIGYGINLEEELPDELLEYLGVADEDDIQAITQEQADYLLDYFIDLAEKELSVLFGDQWEALSPLRQEVLVNLHFNLGLPRLKAFRKMISAIRNESWAEAAEQMLDSKAAKQTGNRYRRLAVAFSNNTEMFLELDERWDHGNSPTPIDASDDATDLSQVSDAELIAELSKRLGVSYNGQL